MSYKTTQGTCQTPYNTFRAQRGIDRSLRQRIPHQPAHPRKLKPTLMAVQASESPTMPPSLSCAERALGLVSVCQKGFGRRGRGELDRTSREGFGMWTVNCGPTNVSSTYTTHVHDGTAHVYKRSHLVHSASRDPGRHGEEAIKHDAGVRGRALGGGRRNGGRGGGH